MTYTAEVYGPLAMRFNAALGIGADDARRVMTAADYDSHTLHVWRENGRWHVTIAHRHLAEHYEGKRAVERAVERVKAWIPLGHIGDIIDGWMQSGARAELALTITQS